MKELLVLRHAKSLHGPEYRSDHVRPLSKRGERNAPAAGRCLKLLDKVPQLIVSSTANRARTTAELAAEAAGFQGEFRLDDDFYETGVDTLIGHLRRFPENVNRALIAGHNPTFEDLIWRLVCSGPSGRGAPGIRLPTGCLVLIQFHLRSWSHIEPGSGQVEWVLPPRLIGKINPDLED